MENEKNINNVSKIAFDILSYKDNHEINIDKPINLGTFFINEYELKDVSTKSICYYIVKHPTLFFNENTLIKEITLMLEFDISDNYYIRIKYKWIIESGQICCKYLVISNVHRV